MKRHIISTVTTKSQTVIPKEIRDNLGIQAGDLIRYLVQGKKVVIEKFTDSESHHPFSAFAEWSSAADERAFKHLNPHD